MTESTWKILKLDWKTPGIFSSKRVGTLKNLSGKSFIDIFFKLMESSCHHLCMQLCEVKLLLFSGQTCHTVGMWEWRSGVVLHNQCCRLCLANRLSWSTSLRSQRNMPWHRWHLRVIFMYFSSLFVIDRVECRKLVYFKQNVSHSQQICIKGSSINDDMRFWVEINSPPLSVTFCHRSRNTPSKMTSHAYDPLPPQSSY